jgi:hypothetical protein
LPPTSTDTETGTPAGCSASTMVILRIPPLCWFALMGSW